MKTEKRIRQELRSFKKMLKAEIEDKDYDNISDTNLVINWLTWVLNDKDEPI